MADPYQRVSGRNTVQKKKEPITIIHQLLALACQISAGRAIAVVPRCARRSARAGVVCDHNAEGKQKRSVRKTQRKLYLADKRPRIPRLRRSCRSFSTLCIRVNRWNADCDRCLLAFQKGQRCSYFLLHITSDPGQLPPLVRDWLDRDAGVEAALQRRAPMKRTPFTLPTLYQHVDSFCGSTFHESIAESMLSIASLNALPRSAARL